MPVISPAFGLLLLSGSALAPGRWEAVRQPGSLDGLPITLRCGLSLPPDSPLLQRQVGQDAADEAADDGRRDPSSWTRRTVCGALLDLLAAAGAHEPPVAVPWTPRLIVDARLDGAWLDSSRVIDQRVGNSISPVAIPRWTLGLDWTVRVQSCTRGSCRESFQGRMQGGAEQGDYEPLVFGDLVRDAVFVSFEDLPRLIADLGPWADLGSASAETVPPAELAEAGAAWPLLADPEEEPRHDGVAFVLGSPVLPLERRREFAIAVLLDGGPLRLRRDVLAWWMGLEAPADSDRPLLPSTAVLLRWLVLRDRSPGMRAVAVSHLTRLPDPDLEEALLAVLGDPDPEVAERALSALRPLDFALPLDSRPLSTPPAPPEIAPWARCLFRRGPASGPMDRWVAALALGGPASERWLLRAVADGSLPSDPTPLLRHPSARLRGATLGALSRDPAREATWFVSAATEEKDPALRILAMRALSTRDAPLAVRAALLGAADPEPTIRAAAASILDPRVDPAAAEALERLRGDPDRAVRRAAAASLRAARRPSR